MSPALASRFSTTAPPGKLHSFLKLCHQSSAFLMRRPSALVSPEFPPRLTGLPWPTLESRHTAAGRLCGWLHRCSRHDARDTCVCEPPLGSVYAECGGGGFFLPQVCPATDLGIPPKSAVREAQQFLQKYPVFFHSPSGQGWGGEGTGLAEVPAHIQSERKVPGQGSAPRQCYFHQPLQCHCLPGADQLPLQSGGPQNHPASDQEEKAGLARRPGHLVPLDLFMCGRSPR